MKEGKNQSKAEMKPHFVWGHDLHERQIFICLHYIRFNKLTN